MNMLKALLLSTVLVFPLKAEVLRGNDCGTDCLWTYDTEKKELIFKGSGTIKSTTGGFQDVINKSEVENIVVEEGFSKLSDYLFYAVGNGNASLFLPESMRDVGAAVTHMGGIKQIDCASDDVLFNAVSLQSVLELSIPASANVLVNAQALSQHSNTGGRQLNVQCKGDIELCRQSLAEVQNFIPHMQINFDYYKKHDKNGRLELEYTKDGLNKYKYDSAGHLVGIFDGNGQRKWGKKIYTVEEAMEATAHGDKFHVSLTYK